MKATNGCIVGRRLSILLALVCLVESTSISYAQSFCASATNNAPSSSIGLPRIDFKPRSIIDNDAKLEANSPVQDGPVNKPTFSLKLCRRALRSLFHWSKYRRRLHIAGPPGAPKAPLRQNLSGKRETSAQTLSRGAKRERDSISPEADLHQDAKPEDSVSKKTSFDPNRDEGTNETDNMRDLRSNCPSGGDGETDPDNEMDNAYSDVLDVNEVLCQIGHGAFGRVFLLRSNRYSARTGIIN